MKSMYFFLLVPVIFIGASDGFASQPKITEISPQEKTALVDSWIKRGEKAIERNKAIMAQKVRTSKQECEAVAERGYIAAGMLMDMELKKSDIKTYVPSGRLLLGEREGVMVTFDYDVRGVTQKKVQMVDQPGVFVPHTMLVINSQAS